MLWYIIRVTHTAWTWKGYSLCTEILDTGMSCAESAIHIKQLPSNPQQSQEFSPVSSLHSALPTYPGPTFEHHKLIEENHCVTINDIEKMLFQSFVTCSPCFIPKPQVQASLVLGTYIPLFVNGGPKRISQFLNWARHGMFIANGPFVWQ